MDVQLQSAFKQLPTPFPISSWVIYEKMRVLETLLVLGFDLELYGICKQSLIVDEYRSVFFNLANVYDAMYNVLKVFSRGISLINI